MNQQITKLQALILHNITSSDHNSEDCDEDIWTADVHNENRTLIGALGTCVQSGLVSVWGAIKGEDSTCALTDKGLEAYRSCGIDFENAPHVYDTDEQLAWLMDQQVSK